MKILLLGHNHASTMNSLKIGLEEIGLEVTAISYDVYRTIYCNYDKIHCVYPGFIQSLPRVLRALLWRFYALKSLPWFKRKIKESDMVIYFSIPSYTLFYDHTFKSSYELKLIDKFVKKKYVWFTGSDIRNPEAELKIDPYFKLAWNDPAYEYRYKESAGNSNRLQALFKKYHFKPIVWDMSDSINRSIFLDHLIVPHASVSDTKISKETSRIQIVHAPSAPVAKGSHFISLAIERLKKERDDFDFHRLQNISNKEYQQRLGEADILIDQVIWGGYGVASQQALQVGKVVLAYLWDSRIKRIYGTDCPVINASPDTLYDKLKEVLDSNDLNEIKRRGQEFYNKMHSPKAVAQKLMEVIKNDS